MLWRLPAGSRNLFIGLGLICALLLVAIPAQATAPGQNGFIVYKKAGKLISIDPEVGDLDGQRDQTLYSSGGRVATAPAISPTFAPIPQQVTDSPTERIIMML